MSKKRELSQGFEDVAGRIDSNSNNKSKSDLEIAIDKPTKAETHTFRGFYLENELVDILNLVTDDKGKGAKSDLVNKILRDRFIEEGWL